MLSSSFCRNSGFIVPASEEIIKNPRSVVCFEGGAQFKAATYSRPNGRSSPRCAARQVDACWTAQPAISVQTAPARRKGGQSVNRRKEPRRKETETNGRLQPILVNDLLRQPIKGLRRRPRGLAIPHLVEHIDEPLVLLSETEGRQRAQMSDHRGRRTRGRGRTLWSS